MKEQELKPLLVCASEAQRLLGISTTKYYAMVKDGVIRTRLLGKRRMAVYASLEAVADGPTPPAASAPAPQPC